MRGKLAVPGGCQHSARLSAREQHHQGPEDHSHRPALKHRSVLHLMYVIHPLFPHYQAEFWACSLELVWSVFLSCHFGLGKYFCLFVVRIKRKSNKENRISLFSSETFTLFHVKYSTMIIDGVIYFLFYH